jgi:hypothetical protein
MSQEITADSRNAEAVAQAVANALPNGKARRKARQAAKGAAQKVAAKTGAVDLSHSGQGRAKKEGQAIASPSKYITYLSDAKNNPTRLLNGERDGNLVLSGRQKTLLLQMQVVANQL